MSKLERGLLPPSTSREKLDQYACALGLEAGTNEWYEFFDLAAVAAGQVPADLLSDEELVAKLPLIFRTLRGDRASDEQLDDLIERVRKA